MLELQLWQKLVLYAFILIALFIFVKTSQIKIINGKELIRLRYRILLALFFPVLFAVFFVIGSIIISILLLVIFIIFLVFILRSRILPKFRRPIRPKSL